MPVHPQCQAILDAMANADGPTVFDTRDPLEARRLYAASTDMFAPPTPDLRSVENRSVPGETADVPVRIYTPEAESGPSGLPVLVFLHGGGWIFGDIDTHDAMCRVLAHEAACLIVSVDYRLAPEHKFPAGLEDCLTVLDWVAANATGIEGDASRIAIGGDSAGGNLAAAACQVARDKGGPPIVFQLLIYPATDFTADMTSPRSNAAGFGLSDVSIEWMRNCYLTDPFDATDPRASPLMAKDLSGLPPALIQTAEFDPLHDEGKAYAEALRNAGGTAIHINYHGMIHGFMRMGALVDDAAVGISDAAKALRGIFE
ncbi:MAG: alpha/beta hydrolase fold domain-containing protein [Alphaproteobacteria bacterium]|nr:alpha/beta hydrolase fold domain-containing protein [Alphaproteobacteria bacterium]